MSSDYLQRIMQRGVPQTNNLIAVARQAAAEVPGGPALAAGAGTQPVVPTPPPLLAGLGAAPDDDTEEGDMDEQHLRQTVVVEGSQQALHLTHIEHEGHVRVVSCRVPRTGVPAVPAAYPRVPACPYPLHVVPVTPPPPPVPGAHQINVLIEIKQPNMAEPLESRSAYVIATDSKYALLGYWLPEREPTEDNPLRPDEWVAHADIIDYRVLPWRTKNAVANATDLKQWDRGGAAGNTYLTDSDFVLMKPRTAQIGNMVGEDLWMCIKEGPFQWRIMDHQMKMTLQNCVEYWKVLPSPPPLSPTLPLPLPAPLRHHPNPHYPTHPTHHSRRRRRVTPLGCSLSLSLTLRVQWTPLTWVHCWASLDFRFANG